MKHEALTDAISMLDDDILAEAQEPFRRRSAAPILMKSCLAAAALCAAVAGFLLIPKSGGVDVLIMGEDPSRQPVAISSGDSGLVSAVRAFSLEYTEIPVEIKSAQKTIISISGGELYLSGEGNERVPAASPYEVDGSGSLIWSVPLWDSVAEFELTAAVGGEVRIYSLSFDEAQQVWNITERSGS